MSMTDPIADMLTRVRNGLRAEKATVAMPSSTAKVSIAAVLKDEGYITDYKVDASGSKATLEITLKYYQGGPVIDELKRISRPGRRVYRSMQDLPTVNGGLGVAIVSTSQGIMSERAARKVGVGGEVICTVY